MRCDQCDYVATTTKYLHDHKQSKHEGVRYRCDQCEHVATINEYLKKHKQSKHEGVRTERRDRTDRTDRKDRTDRTDPGSSFFLILERNPGLTLVFLFG